MKKILFLVMVALLFVNGKTLQHEDVELALDSKSDLGEGSIWNDKTGELLWVDIPRKILNFYDPKLNINKKMQVGQMIGTVVPAESGKVIAALENGFYQLDVTTGEKLFIADPEENIEGNRFNDGKCDPAGRFWAGTMSMRGERNAGSLYRLDPDGSVHKMIDSVTTSNGIVWSIDATKMYYIDTPTQKVTAWDYDNETGEISNPRTAIEIPRSLGAPDGMTIDAEGNLWIALWGGSAVSCWDPENGKLLRTIEIPAKNVTSCAFGDDDLGTLYITTARSGTSKEDLEKFPHSGGLFKTKPGTKGVKAFFFKGEF